MRATRTILMAGASLLLATGVALAGSGGGGGNGGSLVGNARVPAAVGSVNAAPRGFATPYPGQSASYPSEAHLAVPAGTSISTANTQPQNWAEEQFSYGPQVR